MEELKVEVNLTEIRLECLKIASVMVASSGYNILELAKQYYNFVMTEEKLKEK